MSDDREDKVTVFSTGIGGLILGGWPKEEQPIVRAALPVGDGEYAELIVAVEGPDLARSVKAHAALLKPLVSSIKSTARSFGISHEEFRSLVYTCACVRGVETERFTREYELNDVGPGQPPPASPAQGDSPCGD